MTTGLVVAGGYSTRFGLAEKPLARIDGEPMLRRIVEACSPLVEELVVECRPDQRPSFRRALEDECHGETFATDAAPDAGPVAGLSAGLTLVSDDTLLVGSCDRPGLTQDCFRACLADLAQPGVEAVVPTIDGRRQPLCGAYDTGALRAAVETVQARGVRRLLAVLEELSVETRPAATLPVAEPWGLRSVDTPQVVALYESPASENALDRGTTKTHERTRLRECTRARLRPTSGD